ncbi:MAG: hypothetical protein ABI586_03745, partial [Candidatus Nanopelagicales bacterium]
YFLSPTPESELTMFDFLAEVGGDPDEYGFDEIPEGDEQIAEAMKTFLRTGGERGSAPCDVAALAESADVDWVHAMQVIELSMRQPPADI